MVLPEQVPGDELTAIFASDPEAIADPFPVWDRLREAAPVHRHGSVVLVSRYADVKALQRDGANLSNRYAIDGTLVAANYARLTDEQVKAAKEIAALESLYMPRSDGETHARLRGIAHRAFTPRRVASMQSSIERYTDLLIGRLATDEPVDFRQTFAYQLPMMAIAEMLGVPDEDRETVNEWSNKLARNRGGDDPVAVMDAHAAMLAFREYIEGTIVPDRRANPGTDLVSALMEASEGEQLTDEELTAMFIVLLFAGHETTTNLLSAGLLELMRHRDQWQRMVDDPTLIPGAVEELLRWLSPVQWVGRVAAADFTIGDLRVARGESVFLLIAAGNRDAEQFPDPNRLDITRANAKSHLSLGFGPHFCLGNSLARMEATIAFTTLAKRFPDVALVDESPGWHGNAMLRSLETLPIVLGNDRGETRA
jgi:cytochrome P450